MGAANAALWSLAWNPIHPFHISSVPAAFVENAVAMAAV